MKMKYTYGLKRGLPIALGYLSVSFGFGISAVSATLTPIQAILISITNLTSAGQAAGISIIAAGGAVLEMIITQAVINMRYSLMGIALTQKLDSSFKYYHRFLVAFGITDEVFGMASAESEPLTPSYMYGLITLPFIGWALGTTLGAYSGEILPNDIRAALCLAIYSMFIAIVVSPSKENKGVLYSVIISVILSCILYYVPFFNEYISQGFSIIICAVISSSIMAVCRPSGEDENE